MWHAVLVLTTLLAGASSQDCVSRPSLAAGENSGHYCVCNSTYCDDAPSLSKPALDSIYYLVTSTKQGLRFQVSRGIFQDIVCIEKPTGTVRIDRKKQYQKIIGFGGAVTDSVGFNIKSLSMQTANRLIRSYFGPGGLDYSMIRTPMGGTDFSLRPYSYAMIPNDTTLSSFNLQPEDFDHKIPIIQSAVQMSKYPIKLITAPWSASPWMKSNHDWTNSGKLLPEYYQIWADYFVKYFKAYRDKGLRFWALTPQNEPMINTYMDTNINGMSWTAAEQRDFIGRNLAPTLDREGFSDIQIFIGDDNRQSLPNWAKTVMGDLKVRKRVAGTAVHFYFDKTVPPSVLDETHSRFPDKLILYTEAANGVIEVQNVMLGSWKRGEDYATNIIQNMNHWVSSWIDWNIALDIDGGPTYVNNNIDSAIIVNATADEFYKQPMYYAIGHFSKYVPPESVRIESKEQNLKDVDHVVFLTPDGAVVLVLLNRNENEVEVIVEDVEKGPTRLHLPSKSITTMKYW